MGNPNYERFTFMGWSWDIVKALALVQDREPDALLPVESWYNMSGIMRIDETYAKTTDLDKPVLLVKIQHPTEGEFPLIIDGWHRIWKAHNEGVETLPVIVLTAEEEEAIRLTGGFPKEKKKRKPKST